MRVVLDLIDLSTRSIYESVSIDVRDVGVFAEKLQIDVNRFLSGGASYEQAEVDLSWIQSTFGLDVPRINVVVYLRLPSKLDELPYEVRTKRELRLMLRGAKPLAAFSDVYPTPTDYWVMPEDVFEPHVLNGFILKREYIELRSPPVPSPYKGIRHLLYALAEQSGESTHISKCGSPLRRAVGTRHWSASKVVYWGIQIGRSMSTSRVRGAGGSELAMLV